MPSQTTDQQATPPPGAEQSGVGFSDAHRLAGMRWILWDGILAMIMMVLTGGVFITGFALNLGASATAIGVLSGLPRLSALMQPLGSYFVERLQMRKLISVWIFGPARALWILVILLPLMGYTGGKSTPALLLAMTVAIVSALMAGFGAVSWLAWMADLVPEKVRGDYFGRRTMLGGGISAAVGLVAGVFIDHWQARSGEDDPGGFILLFTVGTLCGLASWYTLIRCPEPPITREPASAIPPYWRMTREVLADANYRQFIIASTVLTLGVWIVGPFFNVYMIKALNWPYWLMTVCTAVSALGSLLVVRLWGRLGDHFGNRAVILTCLLGASALPLPWVLSAGGSWVPVVIAQLLGGAAWSGIFLAQMNLVFKITPDDHKSVYIGMFYAISALPSLIAPILGGQFLERTADWSLQVGSWTFLNYHILMVASSAFRFASIPFFRRVREPHAKRVVHMIRVLSHVRSLNPALGLQYYGHVVSDVASEGTRRAAKAVRRTTARVLHRRHDDKSEGAD